MESHESGTLPAEILIATTWDCNLRCTYCFVRQSAIAQDCAPMSPGLAERVVDALDEGLPQAEPICLHLYGGEPLTNLPAVEAMLARASEKRPRRFRFAVTTNGTCVSDDVIAILAAGRFDVIVSIDGPAEVHDQCRRTAESAPTHATVIHFIHALRAQTSCRIRASAVVRSGWSLRQATEYLYTLPVDAIKAQAVRGVGRPEYALSRAERQAYCTDLQIVGSLVTAELEAGRVPRDDRYSSRLLQLLAGRPRRAFCGAGETTFGVRPLGQVLPCILMDPESNLLGHVSGDPQLWVRAGRDWRTSRQSRAACRRCHAYHLCAGGCPALMPLCGDDECEIIRQNCEVATAIFERFRSSPEVLLTLAGVT